MANGGPQGPDSLPDASPPQQPEAVMEIGCPHGAWGMVVPCPSCGTPRHVSPSQHVSDRFLNEVERGEREYPSEAVPPSSDIKHDPSLRALGERFRQGEVTWGKLVESLLGAVAPPLPVDPDDILFRLELWAGMPPPRATTEQWKAWWDEGFDLRSEARALAASVPLPVDPERLCAFCDSPDHTLEAHRPVPLPVDPARITITPDEEGLARNLAAAIADACSGPLPVDQSDYDTTILEGYAGPLPVDPDDEPEAYMCPNCITPWKCNGPHLSLGASGPLPVDPREAIIEILHRYECDEEPLPHDWREHLPEDEPEVHPNRIDALVDLFAAASVPLPVDGLREALKAALIMEGLLPAVAVSNADEWGNAVPDREAQAAYQDQATDRILARLSDREPE